MAQHPEHLDLLDDPRLTLEAAVELLILRGAFDVNDVVHGWREGWGDPDAHCPAA